MNKNNELRLATDFPRLYREWRQPGSCMYWGFECGDGWYELLYKLSVDIEQAARDAGLDPVSDGWPMARQVKEKFGTLRYYIAVGTPDELNLGDAPAPAGVIEIRSFAGIDSIRNLISEAEARSAAICYDCGLPGSLKSDGWWRVTCPTCEDMRCQEGKL